MFQGHGIALGPCFFRFLSRVANEFSLATFIIPSLILIV
jgi:hypothetical protein